MLTVEHLRKTYGHKQVIGNIDFHVEKGESFGLLGPNGAGKSTMIGMIAGVIKLSSGDVFVGGNSIKTSPVVVKNLIGVVPQEIALYPTMTASENLMFWGRMHGMSRLEAKKRTHEVLELVGLVERSREKIETFSGGMKRRVNIAAALMHHPQLLIMDEPTVGIDPQSRNHILDTVKQLNGEGLTVIYTSHYMEEVEFLCKRIAIIDHGEMIALGTKQDLIERLAGGTSIQLKVEHPSDCISELKKLDQIIEVLPKPETSMIELFVHDTQSAIRDIFSWADNRAVTIQSYEVKEPNLESLFLSLTGRTLRD